MTTLPNRKTSLSAIEYRIKVWSQGGASPRALLALPAALFALVFVLVVPISYPYVKSALLLLAPIFAWRLVMKLSTASASHADQLDKLLDAYEPTDADAFRELQSAAMAAGELQLGMAKSWLSRESEACLAARGVFPAPKVLRFVERKV
jgi:hypothetical protein